MNSVKQCTIPSDAIGATNAGPTLGAYLATAHWEFETTEGGRAYLSWASQQLQQDGFTLKMFDDSTRVFAKASGGEDESVAIHAAPFAGKLRVRITYTLDPD